ncbi:hypothetical protein BC332_14140 [Capsicum chinense]|nr:hypothetical protein BC332_14140 [Capsicum chinense]
MVYIAERGYRAVAPDLRGYGDTTGAPVNDISKFSICHLVGDIVALLEAIDPNEDKMFVVAHDWGAIIAWHLCLFRPDKVKALVNLSVHFSPRNPHMNWVEWFKALYGEDHYILRFQDVFASVVEKSALVWGPHLALSFSGKGIDAVPDASAALSSWLSEEGLDYFASKFEKTGFTGPVNYYRALPLNWELTAPWTGAQVKVPTKFIVGEFDLVYRIPGAKEYIHNDGFKKDVPLLEEVVVVEDHALGRDSEWWLEHKRGASRDQRGWAVTRSGGLNTRGVPVVTNEDRSTHEECGGLDQRGGVSRDQRGRWFSNGGDCYEPIVPHLSATRCGGQCARSVVAWTKESVSALTNKVVGSPAEAIVMNQLSLVGSPAEAIVMNQLSHIYQASLLGWTLPFGL